jgi:hypothetical protein
MIAFTSGWKVQCTRRGAMDVEAPAATNNRAGKPAVSNRSKPSGQPGDALTRREALKAATCPPQRSILESATS